MIDKPGLYDIPAEEYHGDPCPEPSLSSSIGKLILRRSPLHGAIRHPRIALDPLREDKETFDLGNAAHTLLLHDGRKLRVIDAPDWRTKAAREDRDEARAAGEIPLLADQYDRTVRMVEACREQVAESEAAGAFDLATGKGEQALIWREDDLWCRALLDWHPRDVRDGGIWYDYKTTAASAHPDDWGGRTGWGLQFDFQAAFYLRGIRTVFGVDSPRMRFVVQERAFPHCLCIIELSPAALAMAERKVERALQIWRECRTKNLWPGYPPRVCYVDPPVWDEKEWIEREEREPMNDDMIETLADWQRPLEEIY
jgi:hypothetical protein